MVNRTIGERMADGWSDLSGRVWQKTVDVVADRCRPPGDSYVGQFYYRVANRTCYAIGEAADNVYCMSPRSRTAIMDPDLRVIGHGA